MNKKLSISKIKSNIQLAKKKIEQLNDEHKKITNYNELKQQISDCIVEENIDKIKDLLDSKYHKIVIRYLFELYDKYESKVSFLYGKFEHSCKFFPTINPNEEIVFNEFISKLLKEKKRKHITHIPMSDWYEKRKSIKEQGESNW